MSFEYFIARRIHFAQVAERRVSSPAVRVATLGIGVGLAVMLIAIAVVVGFKQEIRNKVIGFGSHIQVTNFENNNSFEMQAISVDSALVDSLKTLQGVRGVNRFCTKPGILKSETDFQGIILKGVDMDFDWEFFRNSLVEGEVPVLSDSVVSDRVLVSRRLAGLMGLQVGDAFYTYFIQDNVRARKFRVSGIYDTGFSDYDKLFLIGDMRQVQRLNGWERTQYSGLEIQIDDFAHLNAVADEVYFATANRFDEDGNAYYTQTVQDLNPQLFSWLELLDMNVWVIIVLMLAVAGFNMISGLLILILDGVQLIGTLKALGSTNWTIRKIFLWQAFFLITKGMFWGNVVGLAVCALQYFFHLLPLDPAAYYVSYVPISFSWLYFVLLNAGTLFVSVLMMVGPSYIVTKISPAAVMRYE